MLVVDWKIVFFLSIVDVSVGSDACLVEVASGDV